MSSHAAIKKSIRVARFSGVIVSQLADSVEVRFRPWLKNYMKLASKLRVRGFKVSIVSSRGTPKLITNASVEDIRSSLGSRALRRKFPKIAIISAVGVVALALVSIPFPKPAMPQKTPIAKADKCQIELLKEILVGSKTSNSVIIHQTIELGGVESGLLSCDEHRYRYTLDLNEAKRVLNLTELDS
jgi:hypothetical protein